MLAITNGKDTFVVSQGAYKDIYRKQGMRPVGEKQQKKEQGVVVDDNSLDDALVALKEKPIAQWTKAEVKVFSEVNEIDISETKAVSEAKEIIKTWLVQNEVAS